MIINNNRTDNNITNINSRAATILMAIKVQNKKREQCGIKEYNGD